MLVKDVAGRDVRLRETAADALATLGNLPRAVSAVADDDPRVRVRVSCSILRAPER